MTADAGGGAGGRLYVRGVCFVLLAGVFLSSGGIIMRHVEAADGWQILFYRSISFSVMVFLFTLWNHRGRTLQAYSQIGWPGIIAAVAIGIAFAFYVIGLIHTTVANLYFILSAGPFLVALLAWVVLRERVQAPVWIAMAAAVLGFAIMFADGLETGHSLGNLIALGATVTFSAGLVALRYAGDRDMTPAVCLGGLVSALLASIMAGDLAISPKDLVLSVLFGTVQLGLGFILITLAVRSVPAAQVALLALTEPILAPIWVWIALDERPTNAALIGGLIVLAAVASQGYLAMRHKQPKGSA